MITKTLGLVLTILFIIGYFNLLIPVIFGALALCLINPVVRRPAG